MKGAALPPASKSNKEVCKFLIACLLLNSGPVFVASDVRWSRKQIQIEKQRYEIVILLIPHRTDKRRSILINV